MQLSTAVTSSGKKGSVSARRDLLPGACAQRRTNRWSVCAEIDQPLLQRCLCVWLVARWRLSFLCACEVEPDVCERGWRFCEPLNSQLPASSFYAPATAVPCLFSLISAVFKTPGRFLFTCSGKHLRCRRFIVSVCLIERFGRLLGAWRWRALLSSLCLAWTRQPHPGRARRGIIRCSLFPSGH